MYSYFVHYEQIVLGFIAVTLGIRVYHISRVVKIKSCLRAGFERRPRRAGRVRRLGAQSVLESLDVRRVGDRVGASEGRGLGAGVGLALGAGDGAGFVGFALGAG